MLTYMQIVIRLWLIFASTLSAVFLYLEWDKERKAKEERIKEQNVIDIYESIVSARSRSSGR